MSEISKAALAEACEEKVEDSLSFSVKQSAFDSVRQELETELAIARVALLALRERAEPVAWRHDDGPFSSGGINQIKICSWKLDCEWVESNPALHRTARAGCA
ncbi:Uncharacterised protein [Cronobacter sakazakii]|nr:Uncharacterised protein [Cronobacter sakazakii]